MTPDSGTMRVRNVERHGGTPVTGQLGVGDTFEPVGGPHSACGGRSVVLGLGMSRRKATASVPDYVPRVELPGDGVFVYVPGVLFRCLRCNGSYCVSE